MFFSIIIPVYNVAPYLRECLDSVLAQTFTDWEAICVDDGSTDGSGAILDEYAVRDKRIKVFHQENGGASAARNKGLRLATGEWLCFIDSDDWVENNYLASFAGLREKADVNFIDIKSFEADSCVVEYGGLHCPLMSVSGNGEWVLMERALGALGDVFGWTCNKVIRRTASKNIFFDENVTCFEDELYALELFEVAQTFQMLDICPYHYRSRGDGLTFGRKHDKKIIEDSFRKLAEKAKVPFVKKLAMIRAAGKATCSCSEKTSFTSYWAAFKQSGKLLNPKYVSAYRCLLVKTYLKRDCAIIRPLVTLCRLTLNFFRSYRIRCEIKK